MTLMTFAWWVKPLAFTGVITVIIGIVIVKILDCFDFDFDLVEWSLRIIGISLLPWLVCIGYTIGWVLINSLILVWTR